MSTRCASRFISTTTSHVLCEQCTRLSVLSTSGCGESEANGTKKASTQNLCDNGMRNNNKKVRDKKRGKRDGINSKIRQKVMKKVCKAALNVASHNGDTLHYKWHEM